MAGDGHIAVPWIVKFYTFTHGDREYLVIARKRRAAANVARTRTAADICADIRHVTIDRAPWWQWPVAVILSFTWAVRMTLERTAATWRGL